MMPNREHIEDLELAISRLRAALGIGKSREMTTAYLAKLQAAIEAAARAVREEQWAREGQVEFLGE
jgi:hypothetical protein